jgi:tetratricopeptide (TPR) repeat protein
MKSVIVLFCSLLFSAGLFAQSVQEGVNHLYADRKMSAKASFERTLAANPNNLEAIYWLGQTNIAMNNIAAARQVYEKALSTNGNAPLILVGMGNVELLEGKTNEARQHFETAITLSRGKKGDDPNVLNAIGRAHVEAANGDIPYAISKLSAAAQLAPNNADILVNLGNAYRKARDGSSAANHYRKAAQANSAFPLPYYRLALLYWTQRNWEIVQENLNKAIAVDQNFAPAYLKLYDYNLRFKRDFATAENLANQYVSHADPSVENDYLKAQTAFIQQKYDESISMGKNILNKAGQNVSPRVYRLVAYSMLAKGDTVGAKPFVDQFFTNVKDGDDIVPMDYLLKAYVYLRQKPDAVRAAIMEGVQSDSVLANQVNFLNEVIDLAKKSGLPLVEADARMISYQLRGTRSNPAELFQIGLPYYKSGDYKKADSIFKGYSKAFPDSIYGYFWSARALSNIDSTMKQGLAVSDYQQVVRVASTDKVRFKSFGLEGVVYLANYFVNIKSDKQKGIEYLTKGLEFDPENAGFQNALKKLSGRGTAATSTKTGTATNAAGNKTTEAKVKQEPGKTKVKAN